jgi:hypothetical protein
LNIVGATNNIRGQRAPLRRTLSEKDDTHYEQRQGFPRTAPARFR